MTFLNREILQTFTEEQIACLHQIYDACKEQGATREMLAPLGAVVWINWQDNTDPKLLEFVHRTRRELDGPPMCNCTHSQCTHWANWKREVERGECNN